MAQDCFNFVTKFFEPINASATHIYHSALELCPTSSIIRKMYYDRCHGLTRFPRVMIGNPDSWDTTISFSGEDRYNHCTWSPCGRFIAAQTERTVEIRNQLNFQLLAVLRPPKPPSLLKAPLQYSPDGRSLACGFSGGIVIWDIQTGGVAQIIECRSDMHSLVWSLDGRTIAAALLSGAAVSGVNAYDVASGAQQFKAELDGEQGFHLWACEKTFRILTKSLSSFESDPRLSISEIGPTCIKIEPLPVVYSSPVTFGFSPSTRRLSLSGPDTLRILDVRNSQSLLEEKSKRSRPCFSPDGSHFAAPHGKGFRVWKFTSSRYVLFGEYSLPQIPTFSLNQLRLEFSPTSTSVLSRYGSVLQIWRLRNPPTAPQTRRQCAAISRSGRHVATAHESQTAVLVTDLHSQAPSQFIDVGGEIEGLAITGNVLLVAFAEEVMGWLLTEEGTVDGVIGNKRADRSDSIWTIASPARRPQLLHFRVGGQVGMIGTSSDDFFPFVYHIETGGVPDRVHQLQRVDLPWVSFYQPLNFLEHRYLRYYNTPHYDTPPEDGWLVSRAAMGKAGWVVDPEGKHRLWIPVEWRVPLDHKNWHHDITTLFVKVGDQPIIIKF